MSKVFSRLCYVFIMFLGIIFLIRSEMIFIEKVCEMYYEERGIE